MTGHSEEAIVEVPLAHVRPVVQDFVDHIVAETWQKRDLSHTWSAGNATPHTRAECADLVLCQQSCSTKVYSAVKYVRRALVFYYVETLLLVLITAAREFLLS